jgi:hypothetical protein
MGYGLWVSTTNNPQHTTDNRQPTTLTDTANNKLPKQQVRQAK